MSLTNDPLIIEITKRIDAEVHDLRMRVSNGGINTLEAYKRNCGVIYGLEQAKDFIAKSIKEFTEDED